MIGFYLKSTLRYIGLSKISSTLNIIGVSVTFVVFFLLASYVVNKLSMGRNISEVKGITYASEILSQEDNEYGMSFSNEGEDKRVQYSIIQVDSGFFNLMGLKIIEGTGFKISSGKEKYNIFNQTALKEFGITNIEKARVSSYPDAPGNIVGIVQDFNYLSFHSPIKPMAFVCKKPESLGYAYLKLSNITTNRPR